MTIPDRRARPQQITFLNVRSVSGWLFTVNAAKIGDDQREKLLAYQLQCADVLSDHFLGPRLAAGIGGLAGSLRESIAPMISAEFARAAQPLIIRIVQVERAVHAAAQRHSLADSSGPAPAIEEARDPYATHEAEERERILLALESTGWNRARAAQILGIPRRTFYRRLQTHGILRPRARVETGAPDAEDDADGPPIEVSGGIGSEGEPAVN